MWSSLHSSSNSAIPSKGPRKTPTTNLANSNPRKMPQRSIPAPTPTIAKPITSPEIHYTPIPNGRVVVTFACPDRTSEYTVRCKGECSRMGVEHWQMIARRQNRPFAYFLMDCDFEKEPYLVRVVENQRGRCLEVRFRKEGYE